MATVNDDFFIEPQVDLRESSPEISTVTNLPATLLRSRWESQHGKFILNRWKANGFARSVLDEMVGKYYGHTDLRGMPLANLHFINTDLSNTDFFAADFRRTVFDHVDLTNSWLSHSDMRKAAFKWSKMDDVLVDDVDFDDQTTFVGIDLAKINFTLAALLQENALAEPRIQHLKRRQPVLARFLAITCDYGRSFARFAVCCLMIILAFGIAFAIVPRALDVQGLGPAIFFSFLTFFKTSQPSLFAASEAGKALFLSEAAVGYIMLGTFVSIIVRRTIGR